jgi:hypothetical protein
MSAVACNDPEPEPIVIKANVPEKVKLNDAFGIADTFKFHIESYETSIDSIQLYEGTNMHIRLGNSDFGVDLRDLNLNFLYNPNSAGIKNFSFRVKASPYSKVLSFQVIVSE